MEPRRALPAALAALLAAPALPQAAPITRTGPVSADISLPGVSALPIGTEASLLTTPSLFLETPALPPLPGDRAAQVEPLPPMFPAAAPIALLPLPAPAALLPQTAAEGPAQDPRPAPPPARESLEVLSREASPQTASSDPSGTDAALQSRYSGAAARTPGDVVALPAASGRAVPSRSPLETGALAAGILVLAALALAAGPLGWKLALFLPLLGITLAPVHLPLSRSLHEVKAKSKGRPKLIRSFEPKEWVFGWEKDAGVASALPSPLGDWVALTLPGTHDGRRDAPRSSHRIFETATGRELARWSDPDKGRLIAASPDGRFLASLTPKGAAVWSLQGDLLYQVPESGSMAMFLPGRVPRLALASGQGVAIYELGPARGSTSSRLRQRLNLPGTRALAVSEDGNLLAAGSVSGAAALWRFDEEERIWREAGTLDAGSPILALEIAESGGMLAAAAEDGVRWWELGPEGAEHLPASDLGFRLAGKRQIPVAAALSRSGSRAAYLFDPGASDGKVTVALWDAAAGRQTQFFDLNGWVNSLAFTADGHLLLSGRRANLIDADPGDPGR